MIAKEAWYGAVLSKEDDTGGRVGRLLKSAMEGDEGALVEMVKLLSRRSTEPNFGGGKDSHFPPFSDKQWIQYYPLLLNLERSKSFDTDWLQDWVWKAAAKKDVLPPIPMKEWEDISDPPMIEYTRSWDVVYQTEGSDELDSFGGMIQPSSGMHFDSEETMSTPREEFKDSLAVDDFMNTLERGWFVDGGQIMIREEFYDIPYEVERMLEDSDSALSYTAYVHISNKQKLAQVLEWMKE